MSDEIENKWEDVSKNNAAHVCRHKVDGGWLYSVTIKGSDTFTVTFVPDIDLIRYQAHLRDAYNQGLAEGEAERKVIYEKGWSQGREEAFASMQSAASGLAPQGQKVAENATTEL